MYYNNRRKWHDAKDRLKELLGVGDLSSLIVDAERLKLDHVPYRFEEQFAAKPRSGVFWAKKDSVINSSFISLCKELGIKTITFSETCLSLGWIFTDASIGDFGDGFYVCCRDGSLDKHSTANDPLGYLEPITHESYTEAYNRTKEASDGEQV